MRKRIALDMDEVIADIEPKFLALYEQETGQKLTKDDLYGKKVYYFEGAKHVTSSALNGKPLLKPKTPTQTAVIPKTTRLTTPRIPAGPLGVVPWYWWVSPYTCHSPPTATLHSWLTAKAK